MIVLPAPDRPRASVIIPAWRRAGLLSQCLSSLARHHSAATPFETVVILNGATPDVVSLVRDGVEGARVVHSKVNLGFGGGCNLAAQTAGGEFLVLLNDDTEVEDGWLDALVETATLHRQAGAVGSRIVSYDGLLLEAGGLVWREGVSSHVGRGLPESTRRHRFLRRTDYCSASSLLVRRSTWDAVGGFDERYFPGYYEDVDLCLSIRRLGQHVLFEPRSCVRHHESGSFDWDSPYKHFVSARSQAQFIAKWSADLDGFPALPRTDDPFERDIVDERALLASRHLPRRCLIIDRPAPDQWPGPGHLHDELTGLLSRGFSISVFLGDATPADDTLAGMGVEVLDGVLEAHLAGPAVLYDAVVFAHARDFGAFAPAVRALQPQAVLVYDATSATSDVLGLAASSRSPAGSPITGADGVTCRSAFDTGLLELVPRRAPLSPSWAEAVERARGEQFRRRGLARPCGGRPR